MGRPKLTSDQEKTLKKSARHLVKVNFRYWELLRRCKVALKTALDEGADCFEIQSTLAAIRAEIPDEPVKKEG